MKKAVFIILISGLSFVTQAQKGRDVPGFRVGVGATLAIPVNGLSGVSIGAGGDLMAQYGFTENIAATADVGYIGLFGKDGGGTVNLFPLRVGLRYYPADAVYLAAKVGAGILTGGGSSVSSTATSFGIGYMINSNMDVSGAYESFSKSGGSFGYIGIRLGILF